MNVTVLDRKPDNQQSQASPASSIATCTRSSSRPDEFDAFLPQRWREHRQTIGGRTRQGLGKASNYPRMSPGNGQRMDAWPPDGSHPGLRPAVHAGTTAGPVRRRLRDAGPAGRRRGRRAQRRVRRRHGDRGQRVAACALVRSRSAAEGRRCRSTSRHQQAAIAEIEKRAGDRRFVQVQIPPRGLEPLGRRRYWPILEACAANGFPVSLHLGGTSGHASTGGGWPSFYHEEHPSYVQTMQTLVTSLVCEGVFEHHSEPEDRAGGRRLRLAAGAVLAARQALEAAARGSAVPARASRPNMCTSISG